ncbi:DivIVA domain-containing protein [Rhodococcus coprophilus]|uniref:Predicted membrane protein n=1 Tax=Rhodococcus coprophilus TaxID=38310 RepID=A0A2X4X179_9NOCA|nr:DivIVA domain-containing protein [Rhodococcus coprophilus]SQI30184.1 Predicted membrane protein [Rhodococcus coprophilus]
MVTVLLYVVVMVVVGAVLFFIASSVFGRSEVLAPIPPGTTTTVLPATDVTGTDVRDLRFQQTWRGYKMSEVDWALDRLAREIDELRAELARTGQETETAPGPVAGPDDSGIENDFEAESENDFESVAEKDFEAEEPTEEVRIVERAAAERRAADRPAAEKPAAERPDVEKSAVERPEEQ